LLVEDKPGVMSRIMDAFRRRLINVDTITVGKSETESLSRIVITMKCEDEVAEKIVKQLRKMIDVVQAERLNTDSSVLRELALIKVRTKNLDERSEVLQLVNIFRAQVVDVTTDTLVIQIVGNVRKINAFLEILKKFEVLEIARTGIVAISRGSKRISPENGAFLKI